MFVFDSVDREVCKQIGGCRETIALRVCARTYIFLNICTMRLNNFRQLASLQEASSQLCLRTQQFFLAENLILVQTER